MWCRSLCCHAETQPGAASGRQLPRGGQSLSPPGWSTQIRHRTGTDSALPSSSPTTVLGLVSVLLQEKDHVASILELCKTALVTRHEPPSSAPKVTKSLGSILPCYTSENPSNYSPSSTERLATESQPVWFQA